MPVVDDHQLVSLRTVGGTAITGFTSSRQVDVTWSWEQRQTTTCKVTVESPLARRTMPPYQEIFPGLHWLDVWASNQQQRYWSGPVLWADGDDETLILHAADPSFLMSKTRVPVTKRWDAADPARIASELWDALCEQHGIAAPALVRDDPRNGVFDFSTTGELAGTELVSDAFARLVDTCGLYWTFVAGRPVFGPAPFEAITTLGVNDFIGKGLRLRRDASQAVNDLVVRGADALAWARADMGGLNWQGIRNIDKVTGVGNVRRAAHDAVAYSAAVRTIVTTPDGGATLSPAAPLRIEQLVPSTRLGIEAYGAQATVEVSRVTVALRQDDVSTSVKLESVNDDVPELLTIDEVSGGGGAV